MGIISKNERIAIAKLGEIKTLMRNTIEACIPNREAPKLVASLHCTVDGKILKLILLETGGKFTLIVRGTVYECELYKKPLGLGVYNVGGIVNIPHMPRKFGVDNS